MDRALLAQSQMFKDLTDEEAESVGEICEIIELRAGDFVFREGDDGDRLYIIDTGEVSRAALARAARDEVLTASTVFSFAPARQTESYGTSFPQISRPFTSGRS